LTPFQSVPVQDSGAALPSTHGLWLSFGRSYRLQFPSGTSGPAAIETALPWHFLGVFTSAQPVGRGVGRPGSSPSSRVNPAFGSVGLQVRLSWLASELPDSLARADACLKVRCELLLLAFSIPHWRMQSPFCGLARPDQAFLTCFEPLSGTPRAFLLASPKVSSA